MWTDRQMDMMKLIPYIVAFLNFVNAPEKHWLAYTAHLNPSARS
jgi:hypothetical protein